MNDDVVREWHEILSELKENHTKLASRILSMIREYEKIYRVHVSGVDYGGEGTIRVAVDTEGARWQVDVSDDSRP